MILPRLAWLEIDTRAFTKNIFALKHVIGAHVKLMTVLKGNAFGLGAIALAKQCQQLPVDYIGVVCLAEAVELRHAGIDLPILILNYIDPDAAKIAIDYGIAITVMDEDVLFAVNDYAGSHYTKAVIHIKVDTGMHRAGVMLHCAEKLILKAAGLKHIVLEGVFTHFATADEEDTTFFDHQKNQFDILLQTLKQKNISIPIIHAANSAATLRFPQAHYDMVRPGIALGGFSPSGLPQTPKVRYLATLTPIATFKTRLVQMRKIPVGDSVGYGRTFITKRPTTVGLLPVGFADGFRRGPVHWGYVLVCGKRAPLLGRVSMDQSSIDLTDIPQAKIGDEVVLIGIQYDQAITAEEIAEKIGTNCHEVLSLITQRVLRIYL